MPPYFAHTHDLARAAGVSPPKRDLIMEMLRAKGHLAVRSHVERDGIKTDADMGTCVEAAREAAAETLRRGEIKRAAKEARESLEAEAEAEEAAAAAVAAAAAAAEGEGLVR